VGQVGQVRQEGRWENLSHPPYPAYLPC
jgi:hypothetical protein